MYFITFNLVNMDLKSYLSYNKKNKLMNSKIHLIKIGVYNAYENRKKNYSFLNAF